MGCGPSRATEASAYGVTRPDASRTRLRPVDRHRSALASRTRVRNRMRHILVERKATRHLARSDIGHSAPPATTTYRSR